LLVCFR